ncbi:TfdA family taurine catabolism dioxygenase TauD [Xylaria nigripes]|nr:TfdA family taurine catabolism dioxygenase TauD [Xylaria nigripes]
MSATATTSIAVEARGPPGQPDISYMPDYEQWQARTALRLKNDNLPKSVPEGYPEKLTGDLAWDGRTVADEYDWTYVLSPEHLIEIDRALAHFQGLNLPLSAVNQKTFPLPTLHAELRRLSAELHAGHGFFVLRGVKVDDHTHEENVIIYAGISAHIAPERGRQDHHFKGEKADVVLSHIIDLSSSEQRGSIGSPAYTTDKQAFHTDFGDIVSLFALETSAAGGASKLVSTWTVYNELAATRPDLIHTLSENWAVESFDNPKRSFLERPLLFHSPATDKNPERVALQYARRYFVGFRALPRNPNIPPITEAQAEALDALHFLGEKFCVNTNFQKGDIQYINNLALFHGRDGFTNTPEKKRHLLRFWLRDAENAWEVPGPLQLVWDQLYKDVTSENQVLPLEPFIRSAAGHDYWS